MRTLIRRSLLTLLVVLLPGLVFAQGIGDAAAKEKQKRQTTPKTKTRLITNDDLKKEEEGKPKSDAGSGASPAVETTPSSTNYQATRESSSGAGNDADSRQKALDQAQAQVDSARSAVAAAEARVKELGDKLNPMSPSFIYAQGSTGDAVGEEMRTREALKGAEVQLAGARDALVQANRNLDDVRQGRPAGSSKER
jgi:hypothetical protein